MVKKTLEVYECDICGEPGERYTVHYPDGILHLDRCGKHNQPLMKLRDAQGQWAPLEPKGRQGYKKSTLSEIEHQRALRDGE